MQKTGILGVAAILAGFVAPQPVSAQQQPQFPGMTFFVTSKPGPDGANFGGLAGADKHCQTLAAAAGAGAKTWRAFLSTQGPNAVNARDRIGKGPWKNAKDVVVGENVEDLISNGRMNIDNSLTERGTKIAGRGYNNNNHDILTGSDAAGRAMAGDKDFTCGNWTKGGEGSAIVGHSDRLGLNDSAPMKSWVSSHPTRGCNMAALNSTGGAGFLYCFAVD